jgi:putative ABC transport system substrate-binding protein
MRRREFITLIGGAAAAWPLAARAQQPGMLPTIGYLGATTPSAESQRVAALVQRLREFGWVESRNLTIEYRYAEGRSERYAELAAEFVRLNVDVIVTYGTPAVAATKQATAVIPIVFAVAGDPIGSGLVASLPRPGGNVTGLSLQKTEVADKRLELLREIVPGLRGLAVMANAGNPVSILEMREVEATARRLGQEVATFEIRRAEGIAPTFEALKGRADALYVCGDPLVDTNRIRIITLALGARLPSMSDFPEYVEAGGLMSYGPNFPDLFRRAAGYVDKILRGAKPGDIPVEPPTKFDFVINLITAKALGLAAQGLDDVAVELGARSASTRRNARPLLPLCGGRHERGRRPLPRAWTAATELSAGSVLHNVPEMQHAATTCASKPQVPWHHHRARRCSRRVQPLRLDRRPAGARIAAPSSAGMASPGRQATLAAGGRRSRAAAW